MAERRMLAKTIIDSDAFMDMPLSAQALYVHLNMRADDDGFVNNPKMIQRMIGASTDDLKLLVVKKFIIAFESGVIVIKHWKINNYIRGDRKKDTFYPEEMALLIEKEVGTYTMIEGPADETTLNETKRQKAYRESNLPYSFEYKIRQAFYGEICPICGFKMSKYTDECGITSDNRKPSIQHNKPISKGGKHELGNISVICHQCNISIKDQETDKLNADEVIKKWDKICMSGKCQSSDGQMSGKCQRRIGEDREGKDSISFIHSAKTENETLDDEPMNLEERESAKREYIGGKLGKGVVFMSPDQFEDLCDKLSLEEINHYMGIVADCELKGKRYTKKTHYQAILDMVAKDRKVGKESKSKKASNKHSSSYDIKKFEKMLEME